MDIFGPFLAAIAAWVISYKHSIRHQYRKIAAHLIGFAWAFLAFSITVIANAPEKKADLPQGNNVESAQLSAQAQPSPATLTEYIKSLKHNATSVETIPRFDNPNKYFVRIEIAKDPLIGGASDWNGIAAEWKTLSIELLTRDDVWKLMASYKTTSNIDWAHIQIEQNGLPYNWQTLTYLEYFGASKANASSLQSVQWLCDFYQKFQSSRPLGQMPKNCK